MHIYLLRRTPILVSRWKSSSTAILYPAIYLSISIYLPVFKVSCAPK